MKKSVFAFISVAVSFCLISADRLTTVPLHVNIAEPPAESEDILSPAREYTETPQSEPRVETAASDIYPGVQTENTDCAMLIAAIDSITCTEMKAQNITGDSAPVDSEAADAAVHTPVCSTYIGIDDNVAVDVYLHSTGKYERMTLREYVTGVISAELPASFPSEAFRAQAIAARTYAVYRLVGGAGDEHPGAVLCDGTGHCCAYISESDYEKKHGDGAAESYTVAEEYVRETEDMVVLYGGKAICAVWHSSSDGWTKASEDVWGGYREYLVSVSSDEEMPTVGHGVGLSQHGARTMAERGASYNDILLHYYSGCVIGVLSQS